MTTDTRICIIGAGLSGLWLASLLVDDGHDVTLIEARDRVGGRVFSPDGYDLGPSWIWPHNRRMLALLDRLGFPHFAQYATGKLIFEDAAGTIQRDLDFATMGGALRVAGGLARITEALAQQLGDRLRLSIPVQRIIEDASGVSVVTPDGTQRAGRVVVALPPRLANAFGVKVPDVPTWMAGHAKLVATYPTSFWRDAGLNGDAISHLGPLAEIHDATPHGTLGGALFGFAHPGAARQPGFQDAAIAQLVRLFGSKAAKPDQVIIKDWSDDPFTAVLADRTMPKAHPAYHGLPSTKRLIYAGTECAPQDGGFLEGALAAAEVAYASLCTAADGFD